MLKRFLAVGPALLVLGYGLWVGPKYDRYVLPAFDGFIYDAMADGPRVFTLAPWGYRILAPWIVHLLPVSSAAVGFYWLSLVCLSATIFVIGSWLQRLGFASGPAALGALALALSPPLRELLNYQVLVDPLALVIIALVLWELAVPRILVLIALFAAGALTKEVCLLLLFAIPLVLVPISGWKKGALQTSLIAGPALSLALYLRATWGEARTVLDGPFLDVVGARLQQSAGLLASTALLSGLAVAALLGLIRESSVPLRVQGVAMWFLTFATILLNPYHFSLPDLPRLSVFAWPALLPLALSGLGFARIREPGRAERFPRLVSVTAVATLLICVSLVLVTDSFRHVPEDAWNQPIAFLARNREGFKTARLLDEGGTFTFDAMSGRFAGPVRETFNLTEGRRHRWFLFDGFGPLASFESGVPQFQGKAELLLPTLTPQPATMSIELEGPEGARVALSVGGREIGSAPADGASTTLSIPQAALVRGDNIVRLTGPDGLTLRLKRFEVRLETPGRR